MATKKADKPAPAKKAATKKAAGPKLIYPPTPHPNPPAAAEELILEPDPATMFGQSPADQGFAVGPKEQTPPERELPDVVGAVTVPADLPNRVDSTGFEPVIVDGKLVHRDHVAAALTDPDD